MEAEKFLAHHSQLSVVCGDFVERKKFPSAIGRHLNRLIENTTVGGKMNRGRCVLGIAKVLLGDKVNSLVEKRCIALGWAIEVLQASFLVQDDVIDRSITRRGRLCWYREEGIGNGAILDGFILESLVYHLISVECGKDFKLFRSIFQIFHGVETITGCGQYIDINMEERSFDQFTAESYACQVRCKTTYYTFIIPILLAKAIVGEPAVVEGPLKKAVILIGELFQIQDDFFDCYGDPQVTGKVGTDIEDRKCSWLFVTAMAVATDPQRALLAACYGRADPAAKEAVRSVYSDLGMVRRFAAAEAEYLARIDRVGRCEITDEREQRIVFMFASYLQRSK